MDLQTGQGLREFRREARDWLGDNAPEERRPTTLGPELREFDAAWQRRQYDGGWAGIAWPREHGGQGLSPVQQIIWYEEVIRSRAPGHGIFEVAFIHAGPTLIMCGSEEQKQTFLPLILRGETPWCQGFSEPEAGSDLASLRTRGEIDGDFLVVTGSKIWTSYAQWADYGELLVRTDANAEKHKGLTWAILDMRLQGVDIRPIMSIDGYPHNCEVFLNEVRIPLENIVGGINNGWSVALSTLAAERGPVLQRLELIVLVDEIVRRVKEDGLLHNRAIAERLAIARAKASALRSIAYYHASTVSNGQQPGPETSAGRVFFGEFRLEVARLAVDVLGPEALEWTPWTKGWLDAFHKTISGGTKDIQKSIIGERLLGLPR